MTANVMNYNVASQKMFLKLGFKKIGEDETGNGYYILNEKRKNNQMKK